MENGDGDPERCRTGDRIGQARYAPSQRKENAAETLAALITLPPGRSIPVPDLLRFSRNYHLKLKGDRVSRLPAAFARVRAVQSSRCPERPRKMVRAYRSRSPPARSAAIQADGAAFSSCLLIRRCANTDVTICHCGGVNV